MITTLGLGIIAALFVVMAFKMDDRHIILKVLALTFTLLTMLSLSSYILNNNQDCEIVLLTENATFIYGDNFTINSEHWDEHSDQPTPNQITGVYLFDEDIEYYYQQVCYDKPGAASTEAAFKLVNYFIRIALIYMFVYIIYWLLNDRGRELLALVEELKRK